MRESKYADLLVHRSTFNDEFTVRENCVATGMQFLNGVGIFNGGYIACSKPFKGVYSVRIKLKDITPAGVQYLIDCRAGGTGYIRFDSATAVSASSGTMYVDGVAGSTISASTKEITVTGITLDTFLTYYGTIYTLGGNYFAGGIELIDVFKRTLSASEVTNLYNNSMTRILYPYRYGITEILNIDSRNGLINDKYGSGVVNTSVLPVRNGSVYAMDFNGSTSKLDCGSGNSLVGDKTFIAWIKPRTLGVGSLGRIFDNGRFVMLMFPSGSGSIFVNSDNATNANSAASSIRLGIYQLITVTRTASGITNIYINGVLSGAPNQSSGTPVEGSVNLFIGAIGSGGREFNGVMSQVRILNGILTASEASQIYTSEKSKYNL